MALKRTRAASGGANSARSGRSRARKRGAPNIVDYTRSEQRSFDERSLCDADLLLFAGVALLEFERVERSGGRLPLTMRELADAPYAAQFSENAYGGKDLAELLQLAAASKRLRDVRLATCKAVLEADRAVQFGGMAFELPSADQQLVVAFRGTGLEMAGWQEDFELAVMEAVPAQRLALDFLERIAHDNPQARLVLAGHSKGGALAEYAALYCASGVAERIERVVSFDGPGLFKLSGDACPQFRTYDEGLRARYALARFPLVRYVFPSFVGLMLEERPLEQMRYCAKAPGAFPHDVTAPLIEDGELVLRVPSTVELMRGTALSRWVGNLTLEERRCFIGAVFAECAELGMQLNVNKMGDLGAWARLVALHYAKVGVEERKVLNRVLGHALREFSLR